MPVTGDQYVWSGPASGAWGVAANWTDTTTGQDPASDHPGVHDLVTVPSRGKVNGFSVYQEITGSGAAASLTIKGFTALDGTFRTGALTFDGDDTNGASVWVGSGDTLTVTRGVTIADSSPGGLYAAGGAIWVGGNDAVGLGASSGGSIQVAGSFNGGSVGVDGTSWIEIGTTGGAQAGSLQVDAGETVSLAADTPTLVNAGNIVDSNQIFYVTNVINTGSISGAQFHQLNDDDPLTVNNTGTITLSGDWIPGAVVNNGVLAVSKAPAGALNNLVGVVTGTGQIQIGAGASIQIVSASAGQTVVFSGGGEGIGISPASDGSQAFNATITGFAQTDTISYDGKVTSATWQSGILSLMNGAAVVAQLHVAGNYSGQTFHAVALSTSSIIYLGGGDDTANPPAGTSGHDKYVWSGPPAGSWDAAANWTDNTTGANPAAFAPGIHDVVTIKQPGAGGYQLITGTGNSASLIVAGAAVLAGAFTTRNLSFLNGSLSLYSGYSLTVKGDADTSTGGLYVAGGTLQVTGNLTGGLTATNGGVARIGSFTTGATFTVDGKSSIEIGTKSNAPAGSFTVDPGATATLSTLHAQTIVNHGTITGAGAGATLYTTQVTNTGAITGVSFTELNDFNSLIGVTNTTTGTITLSSGGFAGAFTNNGLLIANGTGDYLADISGKGQIQIGVGASLSTHHASANQTITFLGSTGELDTDAYSLDSFHTYQARIASFAPGDVIAYTSGTATSVVYTAGTGILALNNGSTNVANFHLQGDYSHDTFHIATSGGETQITVTANASTTMAGVSASPIGESFDFSGVAGSHASTSDAPAASYATGGVADMSAQLDTSHLGALIDPAGVADAQLLAWAHHAPDFVL